MQYPPRALPWADMLTPLRGRKETPQRIPSLHLLNIANEFATSSLFSELFRHDLKQPLSRPLFLTESLNPVDKLRLNFPLGIRAIAVDVHLGFIELYPKQLNWAFSAMYVSVDSLPRILILDKLNSIRRRARNGPLEIVGVSPVPLDPDSVANLELHTEPQHDIRRFVRNTSRPAAGIRRPPCRNRAWEDTPIACLKSTRCRTCRMIDAQERGENNWGQMPKQRRVAVSRRNSAAS